MPHQTRTCIGCGQTDDHPRLVVAGTLGDHKADITWHHDCWVIAHPDDGSDIGVTHMHEFVAAAKGAKGEDFRKFALGAAADKIRERHTAERDALYPGLVG